MEACRLVIVATTRAALLRGANAPDALGDETDNNMTPVPGFEDFPISIIEKDGHEFDQASATWRSVRKLIGRVSASVPVDEGDRIKDLRDGKIYALDNFRAAARGLSGRSSVTMNLRRTSP